VFAPVLLSTTGRLTDEEIEQVTHVLTAAGVVEIWRVAEL